ncbi:MAG: hypothetical protein HUU38_23115, partial [Anaerolineales bacterium]|nr:hypothetical protein [Anaerolineales bacterium]
MMKSQKFPWLMVAGVILVAILAISALSWPKQTAGADPVLRFPAAPAGTSSGNTTAQVNTEAPIAPVVVDLKDVPAGVYDPDNKYEQWLRGEIDPRENEFRKGEMIAAELMAEALKMPASANIQIATGGPGLIAPVPVICFASMYYNECCGGGGSVPPDPEMAAGPNHLISAVNVSFEIYDKAGNTLVAATTLDSL